MPEVDGMRRKPYCCDASRQMYEDYYGRQVGGEIPVFRGAKYQRGHGLGSVIGGLFRRVVLPFLKTSGQFLKKNKGTILANALKTGMEVADDVLEGKSLKESAKKRAWSGIKRTADSLDWQTGSGPRKRRKSVRRRRRQRDIFS